ncbi:hypothetical protein ACKW6Q_12840 [Chryseobacterium kwangjuense]|uniref:Lipocalin-like domain-containing protein n=1 Tax=Chryseobacterium kwangjuense TaxID=267125 RepID=A0ABW9K554_9FLAO
MKNITYVITLFILFSCSDQKNKILGKYEYIGNQTIDSIIIEDSIYTHMIFNKDGKLMYKGNSQWQFEGNRIIFLNFYNNEDYNLTEFLTEEQANKFLIRLSCPININNKGAIIEVNSHENIVYQKNN